MPMVRNELVQLIESGRALAFNCHEIGSRIAADDAVGKLFTNKALNKALFFKTMERDDSGPTAVSTMRTLIYFPYNLDNINEGGDSILFDAPGFHTALRLKTGMDTASEASRAEYAKDLEILEMVYALPTFDPFLLKSKALQLDLSDRIHPDYLNISEAEWSKIRGSIRHKIRLLVERALVEAASTADPEAIEQYVSLFLNKIWEARDIEGIEDFVASLAIPAERAPDLFFAWKAICFYQAEFADAMADLTRFFRWLGNDELVYPSNWEQLHPEEKDRLEQAIESLRARVRASYRDIKRVLDTYEHSYQKFLEAGLPQDFKDFLSEADSHYVNIAANLSANLHGVKIWAAMVGKRGDRLTHDRSVELIDSLSGLFDVQPGRPQATALAGAAPSGGPYRGANAVIGEDFQQ